MCYGEVAQLARAFGSYPKGRGFDPPSRYHIWNEELVKVLFLCYNEYVEEKLHTIKKEHLILQCWVLPIFWVHLIHCWVRWFSFHIKTINSNNTNRKIIMINEKINKSFLNILPPPFLCRNSAITQLIKYSNINLL